MNRKLIIFFLILFILYSCKGKNRDRVNLSKDLSLNQYTEIQIAASDTVDFLTISTAEIPDSLNVSQIESDGVFFVQLSTEEGDSLEKVDPNAYEVLSENINNTSMSASELLTSLKITQFWSDKRYVKFELNGQKYILDTRKNEKVRTGFCMLFKKGKRPMIIDIELLTEKLLSKFYN